MDPKHIRTYIVNPVLLQTMCHLQEQCRISTISQFCAPVCGLGLPIWPSTIWSGNQNASHLAHNLIFHSRAKHIEINFTSSMRRLFAMSLSFFMCQLINSLKKHLSPSQFRNLSSKLSMLPSPQSLRGDDNSRPNNLNHSSFVITFIFMCSLLHTLGDICLIALGLDLSWYTPINYYELFSKGNLVVAFPKVDSYHRWYFGLAAWHTNKIVLFNFWMVFEI